jgi:PAS domain S-box-containing protein
VNPDEGNRIGTPILIVEDSLTQALLLKRLLEENGYDVNHAESGVKALEVLGNSKPALIISDIVMPEMDGFELTYRVKQDPVLSEIPVILLTALSDPEDIVRGLEAQVDFYLTKPYNHDFLLSKVASVVSSPVKNKTKDPQLLEINLWGITKQVAVDVERSLSFLASTYENAIQINNELKREIAERKKIERELRVTVERLKQMESIIEISPAVAFVRSAAENWPIMFVSTNVLQFDYESEDLLDGRMNYADIIHPDDRERVMTEVAQYASDKNVEEFSQEYRIVTGYGSERWVDDRTFVRRDSSGGATHYQGIILDVTDRKRSSEGQV